MNRSLYLIGNWKMHYAPAKASEFLCQLSSSLPFDEALHIGIAAPYVSLAAMLAGRQSFGTRRLLIGAQNVHWEPQGAFTGEVSAPMLAELGVDLCIVGHSERRQYFGEDDASAAKRARASLAHGFLTILCVGESASERQHGDIQAVFRRQLSPLASDSPLSHPDRLIIAYEPVWAIGTGAVASPQQISSALCQINDLWSALFETPPPPIIYGGSVKPSNAQELANIPEVRGFLPGGASLEREAFCSIAEALHARITSGPLTKCEVSQTR